MNVDLSNLLSAIKRTPEGHTSETSGVHTSESAGNTEIPIDIGVQIDKNEAPKGAMNAYGTREVFNKFTGELTGYITYFKRIVKATPGVHRQFVRSACD